MTARQRIDRHDKEIAAIRKLIVTGMKMLNRNQEQIHDVARELKQLAAAQRKTEASLRAFLDGMKRGNGHVKTKVDLQ